MAVFSLSVHASYACRHAGACCHAGWRIPVEPERRGLIPVEALVPDASGACTLYDRTSGLCSVQRDHGARAMPRSCDQFPRVSLKDGRGTFVTLSHFCPTAARMLVEDTAPLTIVASPGAFPEDRFYDALDGRDEWPPLLRPSVMFDLATYGRWEQFVVGTLAEERLTIEERLDTIAAAAESLRGWKADGRDLRAHADAVFAAAPPGNRPDFYAQFTGLDAYRAVFGFARGRPAVSPAAVTQPDGDAVASIVGWNECSPAIARFLAAKAFGSWCAYQAHGIRTLVAELIVSLTVLRVEAARVAAGAPRGLTSDLMIEAIRHADWLLVHTVDRERLTEWLGGVEGAAPRA